MTNGHDTKPFLHAFLREKLTQGQVSRDGTRQAFRQSKNIFNGPYFKERERGEKVGEIWTAQNTFGRFKLALGTTCAAARSAPKIHFWTPAKNPTGHYKFSCCHSHSSHNHLVS